MIFGRSACVESCQEALSHMRGIEPLCVYITFHSKAPPYPFSQTQNVRGFPVPPPHTTGTTHIETTIPTGGTKVLPLSIHGSFDMTSAPPPQTVYGRRNTHRVPHIAYVGFLLPPLYQ